MFRIFFAALAMGATGTPLPACEYEGVYVLVEEAVVRVRCDGSRLRVDRFGHPTRALARAGSDRFAAADRRWRFRRDGDGAVAGFTEWRGRRRLDWTRR